MTVAIYMFVGILFSLLICGFYKPEFIFGKKRYCYYKTISTFSLSAKTAYLPIIFFLFLLFMVFSVFRIIEVGGIGGMDAIIYKQRFENANKPLIQSLVTQMYEPGYGLFVWIIRKISSDFRLFLMVYYIIIFVIQIKILSKIKITVVTVFSYFTICFLAILLSFCLMRNILAFFITCMAYLFLDEKKYKVSFLWITVAVLTHFSAVICYPVLLICFLSEKNKFSLKKALFYWSVLFGVFSLISLFIPNILLLINDKYIVYLFSNDSAIALNTFIGRSYLLLLVIWKFNVLIHRNQMNRIMFVVLLVSMLIIPLQRVLHIMYRMLFFADLAVFFLIPELFYVFSLKKKNYLINIFIRLSLFFYLFWTIISFYRNGIPAYGLDNYYNILLN